VSSSSLQAFCSFRARALDQPESEIDGALAGCGAFLHLRDEKFSCETPHFAAWSGNGADRRCHLAGDFEVVETQYRDLFRNFDRTPLTLEECPRRQVVVAEENRVCLGILFHHFRQKPPAETDGGGFIQTLYLVTLTASVRLAALEIEITGVPLRIRPTRPARTPPGPSSRNWLQWR
jgi:hypothetical protein